MLFRSNEEDIKQSDTDNPLNKNIIVSLSSNSLNMQKEQANDNYIKESTEVKVRTSINNLLNRKSSTRIDNSNNRDRSQELLNESIEKIKRKYNSGTIPKKEIVNISFDLCKSCRTDLQSFLKYLKGSISTEFTVAEFISLTTEYLKKRFEVRKVAIETRRGINEFLKFFDESNIDLKSLFINISGNCKFLDKYEQIQEFILKSLEKSEITLSTTEGDTQNIIIEDIIKKITQYKNLEFHTILICITENVLDNEKIIFTLSPSKLMKSQTDETMKKLRDSIDKYENIYQLKINQGEDTSTTKDLILLLKKKMNTVSNTQLESMRLGQTPLKNNERIFKEDKLNCRIREIYWFYCKQQYSLENRTTFDRIGNAMSYMIIGEFMTFCRDFQVPLKVSKLTELFKRQAKLGRELNFENFLVYFIKP